MKSSFLVFAGLLLTLAFAQAQSQPCGTPPIKDTWLTKFQQAPEQFLIPEDDTLYIPMAVHLVGNTNGTGYMRFEDLLKSLCTLNADFAQAGIQYYLGQVHYINNSAYFNHETILDGYEMMTANDIPDMLNSYVVNNPAGNCGYNLPYASIALGRGCISNGNHTWAHEVGHAFTLPHPFLGWEGHTYQSGDTAPVTITYDYTFFQDTLILDTLIIDTTFVEKVDGSNCLVAADGFCDTPPDYLSSGWVCNTQNQSSLWQTDPNGDQFKSDGSLFMAYSVDECQSTFSPDQITAMRAYIVNEKPNFLSNTSPVYLSPEQTVLLAPNNEDTTSIYSTSLVWSSSGAQAHYHLRVSPASNLSVIAVDTFLTDTTFVLTELTEHNYYWRVQAFNDYTFCIPTSEKGKFYASNTVAILNAPIGDWALSPTILGRGQEIRITSNQSFLDNTSIFVLDLMGQVIQKEPITTGSQEHHFYLSEKADNGIFIIGLQNEAGPILYQRILVK